MAERPILFSGPLVRAILDGKKSQTRRVVTERTSLFNGSSWTQGMWARMDFADAFVDAGPSPAGNSGPYLQVSRPEDRTRHRVYPRVFPRDLLWVRETHCIDPEEVIYRADRAGWLHEDEQLVGQMYWVSSDFEPKTRWRPSIHMPKWAARIWLEVTKVRVERLQDISEDDARLEGAPDPRNQIEGHECVGDDCKYCRADDLAEPRRFGFSKLWDEINGEREGCAWSDNSWVWVIEFKRAEKPA